MATVITETNTYLDDFARIEKEQAALGASWLTPVRKAAIARFSAAGFPTTRDEEWRFTSVAPIAGTPFRLAAMDARPVPPEVIRGVLPESAAARRLVFVDGHYAPGLSAFEGPTEGVTAASLRETLHKNPGAVERHLAHYASYRASAFTALNTAFLSDGAFVRVPRGAVVTEPIHLLFVATGGAEPTVSHPRVLIVVEDGGQASFVESYVGLDGGTYFTNAVTEIFAGDGAVVDHCRVQRESEDAYHVATVQIQQDRGSTLSSHAVHLGGRLVRSDVNAVLSGEGGDCTLNGLFVGRGRQHLDNHLRVEHAAPHCSSREYYKGILDDESRGVFSGRIVVHKGAQKTDAKQTNMNLLLSPAAQIDTKPQLEIFADDVKCTHGATIGQVDEDAIFYLRSRGIDREAARALLIYAFADDSLGRIRAEAVRDQLRADLRARLPHGESIREDA